MATSLQVIAPAAATESPRFHISLNVDNLSASVSFFQCLFDASPTKHAQDYAKFDLEEPPLVLSLEPARAPLAGKLNHLGIRLSSAEALVAMQRRLETAGIRTTREDGVECCYARQTKFWINDPDGNLWEVYVLEDDLPHRGVGKPPEHAAALTETPPETSAAPAIWAHRLGEPTPTRIYAEAGSVDEVFLQGTFNARLKPEETEQILGEVVRVLKPGGHVTLYQLSAKTPLVNLSRPLPGPAAAVEAVPSAWELAESLKTAGFFGVHFSQLATDACFVADGVECRETRLVARKPAPASRRTCEVLYKGPHRQVEDDGEQTYRRGEWKQVESSIADELERGPQGDSFVIRK